MSFWIYKVATHDLNLTMVLFSAPNRAALLLAGVADAAAWWKATTQEIKEPSAQIVNHSILLEHGWSFEGGFYNGNNDL